MNPTKLLLPLALLPAALSAQTTVFSANFAGGELNPASYDVGGDWTIASTKAITASSIDGSGLSFTIANTSSGFAEVQGRVLSSQPTLSTTGDFLRMTVNFTNVSNLMAGGDSSVAFGLFNSAGQNPLNGLSNNLSGTDLTTGGAADWSGYVLRFVNTGTNAIYTRPVQTDTTNEAQELLYNNRGGGAYDNPGGTDVATSAVTGLTLTAGTAYTAQFTITLNGGGGHDLSGALYLGTGTGGTLLASVAGTLATPVTTALGGVSVGFRDGDSVGTDANNMRITGLTLETAAIPEPSSFAALAGLAGFALVGLRRRRL